MLVKNKKTRIYATPAVKGLNKSKLLNFKDSQFYLTFNCLRASANISYFPVIHMLNQMLPRQEITNPIKTLVLLTHI